MHDAVSGGQKVHPALVWPAKRRSRTGDCGGQTAAGLVLVEVARLEDEHRDVDRLARPQAPQPRT